MSKKLTSILLALAMVLSSLSFALADGIYTPGTYEATGKGYSDKDIISRVGTRNYAFLNEADTDDDFESLFDQLNDGRKWMFHSVSGVHSMRIWPFHWLPRE